MVIRFGKVSSRNSAVTIPVLYYRDVMYGALLFFLAHCPLSFPFSALCCEAELEHPRKVTLRSLLSNPTNIRSRGEEGMDREGY